MSRIRNVSTYLLALGCAVGPGAYAAGCAKIVVPPPPDTQTTPDNVFAPVFDDLPTQSAVEGVRLEFDVDASDPDGGTVAITLDDAPTGSTVSTSGQFTWTPGPDTVDQDVADIELTFRATDDGTPARDATLVVTVRVRNNSDDDLLADDEDDDDDNDGLTDEAEEAIGTDPRRPDTDNDTVSDKDDICPLHPDPDQVDTDGDGKGDVCDDDDDGDGIPDVADTCPLVSDPDQVDTDGDGDGDLCDDDDDGDSLNDAPDNCPLVFNPDQKNLDQDEFGDVCDDDRDNDDTPNDEDNCPDTASLDQTDTDGDGDGDPCDNDDDGDGFLDDEDKCPLIADDQADADSDGVGDACDICKDSAANVDDDQDGACDDVDNCPGAANPLQEDLDNDTLGDVCDDDDDGDGVNDLEDNCPLHPNDQQDCDDDGEGDVCDPDDDNDGVADVDDNCVCAHNPDQADCDTDEMGDACDDDDDNDGVPDAQDNCVCGANPTQTDLDDDGMGDVCDPDIDGDTWVNEEDNCPTLANHDQANCDGDQAGDLCDINDDNDLLADDVDNCRCVANNDQADHEGDGLGDACDPDDDNDLVPDLDDLCPLIPDPGQVDADGDGIGAACDDSIKIPIPGAAPVLGDATDDTIALSFPGIGLGFVINPTASSNIPLQGATEAPTVSGDHTSYFQATTLLRVVGADATAVFEEKATGTVPLLTVGDGTALVEYAGSVHRLSGAAEPTTVATANAFVDALGQGWTTDAGGTVFVPGRQPSGATELTRVLASGGVLAPQNQQSVALYDSGAKDLWACVTTSGVAEFHHYVDGVSTQSVVLDGASGCADVAVHSDGAQGWFVQWAPATGYASLSWPAQTGDETLPGTKLWSHGPLSPYFAGDTTWILMPCASDDCAEVVGPGPTNTLTGYGHVGATASDGRIAVVYRTKKTGGSPLKLMMATAESTVEVTMAQSETAPTILDLWTLPGGGAWAQVLGTFDGALGVRMFGVGAGGAVQTTLLGAGEGTLTPHATGGLLSLNGADGGFYAVEGGTASKLSGPVSNHESVGTSAGTHFVRWTESTGSRFGAYVEGDLDVVLEEDVEYAADDDDGFWITWKGGVGRVQAGKLTNTWTGEEAGIVWWRPAGIERPWGTWVSDGAVTTWCSADGPCYETPGQAQWWHVTPSGRLHVVWFEGTQPVLWRNL